MREVLPDTLFEHSYIYSICTVIVECSIGILSRMIIIGIVFGIIAFILFVVFVISGFLALWLSLRYSRKEFVLLILLYAFYLVAAHFINQSDNTFSDTNHGFLGTWNVPAVGLDLLAAFGVQLYTVFRHFKKLRRKKS